MSDQHHGNRPNSVSNALDRRNILLNGTALVAVLALGSAASVETAHAQAPPYNIVFLIVDQRAYRLLAGPDYALPGFDAITRHGVSFQNHYISSAMCTPSRASFLSGQPPQSTGVIDQMQYSFVHSLSPDMPNVGSVLKGLGYKTAYFGKFEMDKAILNPEPNINYSTAYQRYGFDVASASGDIGSDPYFGFHNDDFIAVEAVRFLNACEATGVSVLHTSAYIRTWMLQERERPASQQGRPMKGL